MDVRPKPIRSYHVKPGSLKYLSQENEGKQTHIVLVTKEFSGFGELYNHLANSLGKFDAAEPHVFLYYEMPFNQEYLPSRRESKQWIARISGLLKSKHPDSFVALSVGEIIRKKELAHSNTGYLISAWKHSAYPKIKRARIDDAIEARLNTAATPYGFWEKRAERFNRRDNPYPHVSLATGHQLEYRVCRDAVDGSRPNRDVITIVSARGMPYDEIGSLAKSQKMLIINDAKSGVHLFHAQAGVYNPDRNKAAFEKALRDDSIKIETLS